MTYLNSLSKGIHCPPPPPHTLVLQSSCPPGFYSTLIYGNLYLLSPSNSSSTDPGPYAPLTSCLPCPLNTFSTLGGSFPCKPCVAYTETLSTGAYQCTAIPGAYESGTNSFSPCPVGTFGTNVSISSSGQSSLFQSSSYPSVVVSSENNITSNASSCISCPTGSSTYLPASTSPQACVCDFGYEPSLLSISSHISSASCTPCQNYTVKLSLGSTACIVVSNTTWLPLDLTNPNVNSLSPQAQNYLNLLASNASIPGLVLLSNNSSFNETLQAAYGTNMSQGSCPSGWSAIAGVCVPCVIGTFKSTNGPGSCVACPLGSSTRYSGATDVAMCECSPGYGFIPNALTCTACSLGFTFKAILGNFGCYPTSIWGAGEFASVSASLTSDTVCTSCFNSTFKNKGGNSDLCTSCTPACPFGAYISTDCTSTSDTVCKTCSPCSSEMYITSGCAGHNDSVCGLCTTFLSCNNSLNLVGQLLQRQYLNGACNGSSTIGPECTDVTICKAGEQTQIGPTPTSDRICMSCPSNTFSSTPNTQVCTNCRLTCGSNQYISQTCTSTSDIVCSNCNFTTLVSTCQAGNGYLIGTCDGTWIGPPQCNPIHLCGPGRGESVPPTLTSDRVCTTCSNGTFNDHNISTGCTACKRYCDAGYSLQSQFCTPTSDAFCKICPSGTFQSNNGSTAVACTSCTESCPAGYFMEGLCTPTTTPKCVPCPLGTYQVTQGAQTACQACDSNCPSGFYLISNCTALANRVCDTCNPGSYQDLAGLQTGCKACTSSSLPCFSGYFLSTPCTPTADSICSTCTSGTYQDENGLQSACKSCMSDCPLGTYLSFNCTESANTVCTTCGLNTYQDSAGVQSSCKTCSPPLCPQGKFLSSPCTATNDRLCIDCSAGTFQDVSNSPSTTCKNCDSSCPAGKYVSMPCTSTANTICSNCTPGFYEAASGSSTACLSCISSCPPGLFMSSSCTATSDAVCTPCPAHSYQDVSNTQSSCKSCLSTCSEGQFLSLNCTPTSDTQCLACYGGAYQDTANVQTSCKLCTASCMAGTFISSTCSATANAICSDCSTGSYQDSNGAQTSCKSCSSACPLGTMFVANCTSTSNISCSPCPAQTYQNDYSLQLYCKSCTPSCNKGTYMAAVCTLTSDTQCSNCGLGTYQDTIGLQTSCKSCTNDCAIGTYLAIQCSSSADTVCGSCNLGSYQDTAGQQTSCKSCSNVCAPGNYFVAPCTLTSDTACSPCTQGLTYQDTSGSQTSCKACLSSCSAGSYMSSLCSSTTNAVCTACSTGTYQDTSGSQTSCKACLTSCSPGFCLSDICSTTSSSQCFLCPTTTTPTTTTTTTSLPIPVDISFACYHTCALMSGTGGVRCWGWNTYGQLGDGTTADLHSPLSSDVLIGVSQISNGCSYTCALMSATGGVRCWGLNSYGDLGDGTTTDLHSPPTSDVLSGVSHIATGYSHTCALMSVTGGVRCWGWNGMGQLGDGTISYLHSPPSIDVLIGVSQIVTGYGHTCALMSATAGVRCWGWNGNGQLGNGATSNVYNPPGSDLLTGVSQIVAGDFHTCALMSATGGVRCWGYNSYGQLGDGTTTDLHSPPSSNVLTGVSYIAAGSYHTCVLMSWTGGIRCWGSNDHGQLGDGTATDLHSPPSSDVLTGGSQIAAGGLDTCALIGSNGDMRCWGANTYGQLGDGTTTMLFSPPSNKIIFP